MNQIRLNLLAGAVGLMTLSVLLGPFLSIPAEFPALATFALLGLTTLDQLGFEGRGTTLVLDWLGQRSPAYRQRILHHEAGHFLVAYLLDIPVTGYSLSAWESLRSGQSGQGGVSFAPLQPPFTPAELERYAIVWMAGIAAEVLVYGAAEGGNDDRQMLQKLWAALGQNGQLQERQAFRQAENLIQTHRTTYQALVTAMEQRASLLECQQLLESVRLR